MRNDKWIKLAYAGCIILPRFKTFLQISPWIYKVKIPIITMEKHLSIGKPDKRNQKETQQNQKTGGQEITPFFK